MNTLSTASVILEENPRREPYFAGMDLLVANAGKFLWNS